MQRYPFVLMALIGLTPACQANHSEELAALTRRVEALEKRGDARRPAARAPRRPDPAQTYYLPERDEDPYRGARHAKVTIVEAYEFACPYCALIEPMLAEALEAYRGTDTLKVVSKQFVVHPQLATDAALATCAAHRQGKFAAFAEGLWTQSWNTASGRPRMKREGLKRPELVKLAERVGLDTAKFKADLGGKACQAKLRRDRADLARVGVHGTPYLFVNGRLYTGARNAAALRKVIEAEAKKADKALASGIRIDQYYAGLMKTAKRSL